MKKPTKLDIQKAEQLYESCVTAMESLKHFDAGRNPVQYMVRKDDHSELCLIVQGADNVRRFDAAIRPIVEDVMPNSKVVIQ